jgi:hypothetical protein
VTQASDPPRRYPKASAWIREAADRLFADWAGAHVPNALECVRLALRARLVAAEAYQDEEQQRREAFERDVLQRLRRVEAMAHQHGAGVR